MKKIIFLLLVFITGFGFAQSGAEQCIIGKKAQYNRLQKFTDFDYPGDQKYDVKYYKLDIAVNQTAQTISGSTTCKAVIVEPNVTGIFFDLANSLTVDSVFVNGILASFTRGSNTLNISLGSTLNQGDVFSTLVYYHGTPGSTGFGSFVFSSHQGTPVIWTLSEPYGAKDWWVAKDTPADKADSADVWITVSTNLTAVSNGKLMQVLDNGNGTHTYKWKSSYPIAQYLLSMAITNYSEYTNYYHYSPTDSMPINHFLYPENLNSNISQLNKTPNMIEIYSQQFGQYPFINEKYGHAQFGWGGGMEHQTVSSMVSFGDGLIAHELAHMWYGDNITCKDWHHIWLNEGFATFGEGIIYENWYGKSSYDNYIAGEMSSARNAVGTIWVQDISNVDQIFNGNRTYSKGCVVLHMLRGVVGDSTFFNILKSYTANPSVRYGVATTEDFQAIAESVSGIDLNYFFQQWIYGEKYPKYHSGFSKNLISGNTWNLSLLINQDANTNPVYFTMPIQIKVTRASGDTTVTVFNNSPSQQFNIAINGEPLSIVFAPNNWILKTHSTIVPVELTSFTAVLVNQKVMLNWTTATELNNHGFEIQRKFENTDWATIAFKSGNGTTTEVTNYTFEDNISDLKKTNIYYRLKQIDYNGEFDYSDEVEEVNFPDVYSLEQNYPNPFNPTTIIKFNLAKAGFTSLKIYDVLGKEVANILNGELEAGHHQVSFDASNLPSGVYMYTVSSGSFTESRKMMFLK
ncbi:MAG TPA: M1 family aminopeptidase [Ignavibacteriaceae bacterium]|nr:M1 family aminopeptidase [Ignavibacteriaceae bacterium]